MAWPSIAKPGKSSHVFAPPMPSSELTAAKYHPPEGSEVCETASKIRDVSADAPFAVSVFSKVSTTKRPADGSYRTLASNVGVLGLSDEKKPRSDCVLKTPPVLV